VSTAFYAFAMIALVIGFVLMLTVVATATEDLTENDKHNTTRSTLFLLLAFTLAIFILVHQRYELVHKIKNMLM